MQAPYAVRVEESRGRRYAEPAHPYRNDFQRDRDRVIHSRAFRRQQNKTQVFTRRYSDHFRNRLTHTLEVSQISRTIAAQLGLNVDLVETLALVHDVGHPPFGHAGEKALDAAMRAHGDSFDHNLHALRIVEDFELRYADFRGLNLTFEVREGIVKQLIDLTDEIGYNTADLDDAYEARLLTVEQIRGGVPLFEAFYREQERQHPQVLEKLKFNETVKRVFDLMVTDLIENTRKRAQDAGAKSLADIRKHPERLAAFSPEVEAARRQSKQFLYEHVYDSAALRPEKDRAERVITELFEHFIAHPNALPASYQERARDSALPRVVCDYVAGMTDNYIFEQHTKMMGGKRR